MRRLIIAERKTNRTSTSLDAYLRDVARIDLFPTPSAEALCAEKAAQGEKKAIDELVRRNLRFVISVAKQYESGHFSLEDLINQGNIGLLAAAEKFDPTTGNKFISYGVWHIRKEIMEYMNKHGRQIRLPSNKVNKISTFKRKIGLLEQELGREADINDMLNKFEEMSSEDIELLLEIGSNTPMSLSKELSVDGDGGTLEDILDTEEYKPTDYNIIEAQNKETLEDLLNSVKPIEKDVIKMCFGIDGDYPMNLNEVGTILNISRERVRQIKEQGLRVIRVKAKNAGITSLMF